MNIAISEPAEKYPFASFLRKTLGSSNLEISPLAGDASTRRYFRVIKNEDSWVLMVWEPFVDNDQYPFLSVRDHFEKHSVNVPKVIARSPDEGLVLLEDLGDLTLERRFWENQNHDLIIPYYQMAIDELIKIHFIASKDKTNCTAFKVFFDTEKLLWEMNYGRTHLIQGLSKIELRPEEDKALTNIFNKICTLLDKEEKFIAHRDYHSRNVMIKLGKARVIDFQDARMGAVQYDLVSLLKDSYVDLDDDISSKLLEYYFEKRQDLGLKPFSKNHFNEIYELQSIQRCFKACGSFSSFYNLRNDSRYLKYLAGTLKRVKKSIEHFSEFKVFSDILENYGLFDESFERS